MYGDVDKIRSTSKNCKLYLLKSFLLFFFFVLVRKILCHILTYFIIII